MLSLPLGFSFEAEVFLENINLKYSFDSLDNVLVFSMAENIAIAVMLNISDLQDTLQNVDHRSLWTVILGIFTAGCAGSVMYNTMKTNISHPQYR
ncbi:hypothetical protein QUF50_09555, partial [Thiotrichales bacterium HSG1]|nr:hypothetical protein [Thiotrichales bacterium HSG1]